MHNTHLLSHASGYIFFLFTLQKWNELEFECTVKEKREESASYVKWTHESHDYDG